jgi:hypothetical protein
MKLDRVLAVMFSAELLASAATPAPPSNNAAPGQKIVGGVTALA